MNRTLGDDVNVASTQTECVVIPFRARSSRPRAAPAPWVVDGMLVTMAASVAAAAAAFISLTVGWIDAYRWVEASLRLAAVC